MSADAAAAQAAAVLAAVGGGPITAGGPLTTSGGMKLVKNSAGWALYDVVADPLEATNLYASAAHAAARASLQAELQKLKAGAAPAYFQ